MTPAKVVSDILEERRAGQCCDGMLASVIVEDDGSFTAVLLNCDANEPEIDGQYATADAVREAAARGILSHFVDAPDGGCKKCEVRRAIP